MSQRILIYTKEKALLSQPSSALLSLVEDFPIEKKTSKPLVKVHKNKHHTRSYHNFKPLDRAIEFKIFYQSFQKPAYKEALWRSTFWALNYRSHKLFNSGLREYIPPHKLFREAYVLTKAYYRYYSLACSLLILLFFSEAGLPRNFSKLNDTLCGTDIFDELFYPIAFPFVVFESTKYLVLGEEPESDEEILRSFISFLLWPYIKPSLKFIYYTLLDAGLRRDQLWITL